MNFNENEIVAAGMIGFDLVEGPYLKFYQEFQTMNFRLDMENFLMNFYLSFRGGDESLQPLAILYHDFYIVAFSRGLELCCLFMRPENIGLKIEKLSQIADGLIMQMDEQEERKLGDEPAQISQDDQEIKRIVINLLHKQEKSTPELRRYFKLTNSEIWRVMSQLEEAKCVMRTQKIGRSQYWTAIS
ncbi:MAG: hypothetical protein ACTSWX_04865 [Promethearchaeota archaeon]